MNVIIFGATGMVGKSVLIEALKKDDIDQVLVITRQSCGIEHFKLNEIILDDLFEVDKCKDDLVGYDACIWAIGVSAVGKTETEYSKVTEDLTLIWANRLLENNPEFSFCYCSAGGAGGYGMWARVRRNVENALRNMSFLHVGVVRPGVIKPAEGITSRTRGYQIGVKLMKPLSSIYPSLISCFPWLFTTSEILGQAMIGIIQGKSKKFILESKDINNFGKSIVGSKI